MLQLVTPSLGVTSSNAIDSISQCSGAPDAIDRRNIHAPTVRHDWTQIATFCIDSNLGMARIAIMGLNRLINGYGRSVLNLKSSRERFQLSARAESDDRDDEATTSKEIQEAAGLCAHRGAKNRKKRGRRLFDLPRRSTAHIAVDAL